MTVEQLTEAKALAFAESGAWESLTARQKAEFQMLQEKLCMPFGEFHRALEQTLGRSVWTHELGLNWEGIKAELFDGAEPPCLADIIALIPPDKRTFIVVPEED